jgi:hypothetical protein
MSAPVLDYSGLSTSQKLTIEPLPGGGIKITSPAGEIDEPIRRELLGQSAIFAGGLSSLILILCLVVFGGMLYEHRHLIPWWTGVVFVVFVAALFAFVARLMYGSAMERAERALQQTSILIIEPRRLLLETTGPLGSESRELDPKHIRSVRVVSGVLSWSHGEIGASHIELSTEEAVALLPGHSMAELRAVARLIEGIR